MIDSDYVLVQPECETKLFSPVYIQQNYDPNAPSPSPPAQTAPKPKIKWSRRRRKIMTIVRGHRLTR